MFVQLIHIPKVTILMDFLSVFLYLALAYQYFIIYPHIQYLLEEQESGFMILVQQSGK